jgi:hypothetical protein
VVERNSRNNGPREKTPTAVLRDPHTKIGQLQPSCALCLVNVLLHITHQAIQALCVLQTLPIDQHLRRGCGLVI